MQKVTFLDLNFSCAYILNYYILITKYILNDMYTSVEYELCYLLTEYMGIVPVP